MIGFLFNVFPTSLSTSLSTCLSTSSRNLDQHSSWLVELQDIGYHRFIQRQITGVIHALLQGNIGTVVFTAVCSQFIHVT